MIQFQLKHVNITIIVSVLQQPLKHTMTYGTNNNVTIDLRDIQLDLA